MASRKDDKERLRQERLAAEAQEKREARRRTILGYAAAGILTAIVMAGIIVAITKGGSNSSGSTQGSCSEPNAHFDSTTGFQNGVPCDTRQGTPPPAVKVADLPTAAKDAGCTLALNLPDYGHKHIDASTKVTYKGEPPTSGNHSPNQMADGAYSQEPDPRNFVHSLEHGRVEFEYSPNLSESDQLAIKGLFDQTPGGVLMFPNSQLTGAVAAAAWRNRMNCPKYEGSKTLNALADFREKFRGIAGRETVPFTP